MLNVLFLIENPSEILFWTSILEPQLPLDGWRRFNVISEAGDRIGSPHFNFEASLDFNSLIANVSLLDIGYFGSKPGAITDRHMVNGGLGLIDVYLIKLG